MRSVRAAQALAFMFLVSTGCGSSATKRTISLQPAALEEVVRSIMAEYSSVKETPGLFTTGWEEEPLSALGAAPPPGARYLRARYDVRLAGNVVEVDARAEMFVSRGAHAHRWASVLATALEHRLLDKVIQRAKIP